MDKRFFLLDNEVLGLKFGIYLEKTEFGVVGIVNCHFLLNDVFEILLTDENGENFYAEITYNPFSFSLPQNFSLKGELFIDIFLKEELIASTSVNKPINSPKLVQENEFSAEMEGWLKSNTNNDDYLNEAKKYILKAKQLYGEVEAEKENSNFMDKIGADFELLFNAGSEDYLLSKKFKNSRWRKIDVGGEIYILGKIYAGASVVDLEEPSFVAMAIPTTLENVKVNKPLGEKAKFYHANIYDNFGFLVLVQNAISGKAVSI